MKIAAISVAVLVAVVAALAAWLGMFSSVTVVEEEVGPLAFVYVQEATTDFSKIGKITTELGERLEQAGLTQRKPAQLYFPAGRGIQNQIGFVVEGSMGQGVLDATAFFRSVPVQRYAVVRFPFRNPLSFLAAYHKVNSKLRAYRKEKGIPESSFMVILDGATIVYLQPVTPG